MNISSLVINVQPATLQDVLHALEKIEGVSWHQYDERGKIIATIEAEEIGTELKALKKIESIQGILSADMVYSYSEELEKERNSIETTKSQNILNDSTNNEHSYGGSVALQLEKALKS